MVSYHITTIAFFGVNLTYSGLQNASSSKLVTSFGLVFCHPSVIYYLPLWCSQSHVLPQEERKTEATQRWTVAKCLHSSSGLLVPNGLRIPKNGQRLVVFPHVTNSIGTARLDPHISPVISASAPPIKSSSPPVVGHQFISPCFDTYELSPPDEDERPLFRS